ncbi:porin [Pseudotabrizicola sp.]|uniref:porin n=1 Tax=Pseudotabrizicola sp. TaxID=2939647 RepID=UPI00271DE2CA|nr:porin [Pseudotabrizicola sp.]MDO8883533.1 porin [Pseudotabrizicola sp.]
MKKVLLATTVLALSATVAAAEVKLSGNARMGVVYNGDAAANKLQFSSRVRAVFTMSGETDSGLAFGGTFRADNAGAAANGSAGNVFISGAFGKLTMGDVVGAAEEVVGDLPEVGFTDLSGGLPASISDNDTLFLTGDGSFYASAGNPGALYTYSTGGLTFAVGMNDGFNQVTLDETQAYSIGVKYAVDGYSVSLGYEVADPSVGSAAKHLIVGGEATFGTTTVKAFYGDGSGALSGLKHYGLGVTHKIDALTVKGYIKKTDLGFVDVTAYGIGADYALGGGATLSGGIIDNNLPGTKVRADLGIKFSF